MMITIEKATEKVSREFPRHSVFRKYFEQTKMKAAIYEILETEDRFVFEFDFANGFWPNDCERYYDPAVPFPMLPSVVIFKRSSDMLIIDDEKDVWARFPSGEYNVIPVEPPLLVSSDRD